jgi:hypothetical protein
LTHITTIGASTDQARGYKYKVSIAHDSTDTSCKSDFRALYFETFESDHENFSPVAEQLAWLQTCGSSSVGLLNWSRNGVTNMQQTTNFQKI